MKVISNNENRNFKTEAILRYIAKSLDLFICLIPFFIFLIILEILDLKINLEKMDNGTRNYTSFLLLIVINAPYDAFFVSKLGHTPGKWLMGISVLECNGSKLTYERALKRSLKVFARGYCLGIPILCYFMPAYHFNSYRLKGFTSWDKDLSLLIKYNIPNIMSATIGFVSIVALSLYFSFQESNVNQPINNREISSITNDKKIIDVEKIAEISLKNLVRINNQSGYFNNNGDYIESKKFGSGFFISDNLIVTNYHVVDNAASLHVKFPLEPHLNSRDVKLLTYDKHNDIALLSYDYKDRKTSDYLSLTSRDTVKTGNKIYVVGNPLGIDGTFSDGIVSNLNMSNNKLIQITAPISPGSSGGPVLNIYGEVIGVATGYLQSGQNLNIVVPSEYIVNLILKLKNNDQKKIRNNFLKNRSFYNLAKKSCFVFLNPYDYFNDDIIKEDNVEILRPTVKNLEDLKSSWGFKDYLTTILYDYYPAVVADPLPSEYNFLSQRYEKYTSIIRLNFPQINIVELEKIKTEEQTKNILKARVEIKGKIDGEEYTESSLHYQINFMNLCSYEFAIIYNNGNLYKPEYIDYANKKIMKMYFDL